MPTEEAHRVSTLAEHFGYDTKDAHRADADVAMLSGIVQSLHQLILTESSGRATYEFLRRVHDPWTQLLTPPTSITTAEIIATFGGHIISLLRHLSCNETRFLTISFGNSLLKLTSVNSLFFMYELSTRSAEESGKWVKVRFFGR